VLSGFPVDARAEAKKAAADFGAGRFDAAGTGYQFIVGHHPDCAEAWTNLGVVRAQQDDFDAAIRAFKNAARLNSHDSATQARLGLCFFEHRKYSAAIPPLERSAALNPNNANVHACLARCYEKVGRRDEALHERQVANQLHPEMVE
jgi:tetratricopeptide (TPR) repeat protein